MTTQLYRFTDKAGPWVAGYRRDPSSLTILLTPAEAELDLLAGTIVPDGVPVTPVTPSGPVDAYDRVVAIRGARNWDFSIADLVAFLGRSDLVDAVMPALQDVLVGKASTGINSDISDLLGIGGTGVRLRAASTMLPAAATVDLGAARALAVTVSGAETISSFGGVPRALSFVRFTGASTLIHNAARLILPGAASIVTAPGDTAMALSDAAGIWTVRAYQRADGLPLGVRRGQLLRAVSTTLPGGLAAFMASGLVSADPDTASNLAFNHEPFALPGGVLAGLLATYCRMDVASGGLGMSPSAAAAQVAALFTLAATLTPGT